MGENGAVQAPQHIAKGLTCHCGSRLFAYSRMLQTNPDGRMMELASGYAAPGFVYFGICLDCARGWIIAGSPKQDTNCEMYAPGSDEAKNLMKKYLQDFDANFDART